MVVIRLSRGGTNRRPFYKVVAADSRAARDCRYLEHVGYFNPIAKGGEKRLELDLERVNYWIGKGAKPSERIANLISEFKSPEIAERRRAKNTALKDRRREKAKAEATSKVEEPAAEA